jgi:hypothetical protein
LLEGIEPGRRKKRYRQENFVRAGEGNRASLQ